MKKFIITAIAALTLTATAALAADLPTTADPVAAAKVEAAAVLASSPKGEEDGRETITPPVLAKRGLYLHQIPLNYWGWGDKVRGCAFVKTHDDGKAVKAFTINRRLLAVEIVKGSCPRAAGEWSIVKTVGFREVGGQLEFIQENGYRFGLVETKPEIFSNRYPNGWKAVAVAAPAAVE